MDATSPYLSSGRQVTLLPRNGGQTWTGVVRRWDTTPAPHVVANIETTHPAVNALDHHQVWLSTMNAADDEFGITIFAGRAVGIGDELLEVDGVVRLATEPRRRAIRGDGASVSFPGTATAPGPWPVVDLSHGGLRVPVGVVGWAQGAEVDMVLHLDEEQDVKAVGRLLRVEANDREAVLELIGLSEPDMAAIDRHVLARLDV
jgi:hypothetical protein